ncbi:polysaccharide deacetylase family protein [Archaeoglobus sp.]
MMLMTEKDIYTLYGLKHFEDKYKLCSQDIVIHVAEKQPACWSEADIISEAGDSEIELNFNVFGAIGRILSGCMEPYFKDRELIKELSKKPFVDLWEKILFDSILSISRIPVVNYSLWPYGKEFAVCLTHDVDEIRKTYQYFTYSARHLKKRNFRGLRNQLVSLFRKLRGNEPFWTFEEIMKVERELGVRSTFFFLNEDAKVNLFDVKTWRHYGRRFDIKEPKVVDVIKRLSSEGWEVGLHGSFHSFKDLSKLRREKEVLEEVLSEKVCGNRQHNLNLSIPETWRYHEEIGLVYDTTLGFNNCVGFRWGTSFPFHPLDGESGRVLELLEIPLVVEDIALFSYEKPWREFLSVAGEVEKCNGTLTVLWHHAVFSDMDFPGWGEMYRKIVEHCAERDAWVATGCEIAKWWKKRESSRIEVEYGNGEMTISAYPENMRHFLDIHISEEVEIEVLSGAEVIKESDRKITISTSDRKVRVVFRDG